MNARVDPRTGQISWPGQAPGLPMGPRPIARGHVFRVRRGLGDIPNASGAAGPLIGVYRENDGLFNPPDLTGGAVLPSGQPAPLTSTTTTLSDGTVVNNPANPATDSTPWGVGRWTNPTTFASVPLNSATNATLAVLTQNFRRNYLLVQNGSTATVAGDIPPTLYIGFNAQPQIGGSLALAPGIGMVFDVICPRDSIFVAFGPFSNGGSSVVIQGAVVTGSFTPSP